MIIYGHRFIDSEPLFHVMDIESIIKTPPLSIIFVEFKEVNLDIIKHLSLNHIKMAISVDNIIQLIYASSFGASFIIVNKDIALEAQNIANNYLFDAKILARIEKEDEIEKMATIGIDGVIFSNAIVKV